MEVIYITIGISVLVALVFFILFIRMVTKGQYDDVETPAIRMLFEDKPLRKRDNK